LGAERNECRTDCAKSAGLHGDRFPHAEIEMVSLMHPALTTVRIPRSEIAAEALTMLLAAIGGSNPKARETIVETKLIIRESTAAPRLKRKKKA